MTLILDMATGEEYQGEGMSCPSATNPTSTRMDRSQEPSQHVQLQLAMVEATPSQHNITFDMAGIDINTLLESIED
ncbi:MAG: hypothetical protein BMS9Abin09_1114 [Gammaproteobacteria bacterium]|nr:MAG: hypothetical protein BMS9Abin09_1114 [Gammaproteobacteria bacterium]